MSQEQRLKVWKLTECKGMLVLRNLSYNGEGFNLVISCFDEEYEYQFTYENCGLGHSPVWSFRFVPDSGTDHSGIPYIDGESHEVVKEYPFSKMIHSKYLKWFNETAPLNQQVLSIDRVEHHSYYTANDQIEVLSECEPKVTRWAREDLEEVESR
ncbi:hypothetical protein JSY36_18435 [Bacillus sp. H-16]|uniref:hypothetical protein n=1 Tax=Alteribacter salitolerans TaxID=2912333 RepID=UPI00196410E2|nr:hypothetical protein [Alteribacter salitolerans]MBM7097717.1 hypothetical protein [Alteribacter salitolerans]